MSNDFAVQPLTAVRTSTETVGEAKTAASQPPPEPEHAASPSPVPNPSLRLDPALGLVVMEFRSETGAVTSSIPSQRQLQAYQKWDATHFGPTPAGMRETRARHPDVPAHGAKNTSAK
jgi:hypothetical protein